MPCTDIISHFVCCPALQGPSQLIGSAKVGLRTICNAEAPDQPWLLLADPSQPATGNTGVAWLKQWLPMLGTEEEGGFSTDNVTCRERTRSE